MPADAADPGAVEIVFGKFCGHCMGNCTQMYKISDRLLADTSDAFLRKGRESMNFNVKMSQADYNSASKLLSMIPEELYELHDSTYGCPDCADQCGYYLEIHKDGKIGRYRIDTQNYNLPAWLKEFPRKMGDLISGLHKS